MESGTRSPVENTRRGVEAMEVAEEAAIEKASMGKIRERITSAAREGWGKLVSRLRGKEFKRRKCVDCGEGLTRDRRGINGQ